MKFNKLFADDRAVSPVIGVILMVAITVILAAVIGTFVLGIAPGDDPAPSAQLGIGGDLVYDDGTGDDWHGMEVIISHNGGSDIVKEDLRIVLRDSDGSNIASADGEDFSGGDIFDVGDSISAGDGEFSTPTRELIEDERITIQIIHTPSGSIIASDSLRVEIDAT